MSEPLSSLSARSRWIVAALVVSLLVGLAFLAFRPKKVVVGSRPVPSHSQPHSHPHVELMAGQEDVLLSVLGRGATLPAGCSYASSEMDPTHVTARYVCAGRATPAVLDLYVGPAPRPINGYTGRFGVATPADFPPTLRADLLARISERENRLFWQTQESLLQVSPRVAPHRRSSRRWTLPSFDQILDMAAHEPSLRLLGLLFFVLAFTRRLLRPEPARVAWMLAAIVVAGALLRLGISVEAPMNAHSFSRLLPLATEFYRGPLLSRISEGGHDIAFTSVQAWSNYALAVAMPIVFFAHARLLLGDARAALVAAAMMAFLPMHIRFSRSDVTFIASLLASSTTFVALYGSLTDPSRGWRLACALLLPALSLATYSARPENMIFVALDLGALCLYLRSGIPWQRLALAGSLIASTAAYSVVTDLMVRYRHDIDGGLSLGTLRQAIGMLFDLRYNTLINPWTTPSALPVLAVVGAVTLWRGAQRRRAVFLIAWLSAFFLVHSYVRPSTVAMQTRYHLHLMSPFLLLAAAATRRVASLPRPAIVGLVAWLVLSPFIHAGFIRDTNYTEMHEYSFLRRTRGQIAPTCTVLEFTPAMNLPRPQYYLAMRAERMTMRLHRGVPRAPRVLSLGTIPPDNDRLDATDQFAPTDDFVAHPPACLYYYESAACTTHRTSPGHLAAPCEEMHRRFVLTPVAEERHPLLPYDDVIIHRVVTDPDGSQTVLSTISGPATVSLGLYRVNARP